MSIQALAYKVNPVGWATCKWLKRFWPGCVFSRLNGLTLRELPIPALPTEDWVLVRTLLGGVCGTDLAILTQKQPPSSILQAYSSQPLLLGHENVAVVEQVGAAVDRSWVGRRVCVEPTLACAVRGIDPPCNACQRGCFGACENFGASGRGPAQLPAGTSIGYNSRTGGAYGTHFVAHHAQLVALPDDLPDEVAILTDPVACALHAVLRADLTHVGRVLIYGAGVLGLAAAACLRALGCTADIDALDVHAYLEPYARRFGADAFLRLPAARPERFAAIAERTGATVLRSRFGNLMLAGGYDLILDCVGSPQSLNEALKWTAARGQLIIVGTGHGGRLDLTPLWFRELTVLGAYGRQLESYQGQRLGTYQLVHRLISAGRLDIGELLSHRFRLEDYRAAFTAATHKSASRALRVAFDFR